MQAALAHAISHFIYPLLNGSCRHHLNCIVLMADSKDTYRTIRTVSTGEFRDKGSKFLAYAYPIAAENDIETALAEVRKLHPKARHHCYAWRLGTDGHLFRANDDGEPSGTAGRPILGQLDSFAVTNVLIVVVRYFGGTLLGTSGLINAYKTAAAAALDAADIYQRVLENVYRLDFAYGKLPQVMTAVSKLNLNIVQQDFGHRGQMDIALRQSEASEIIEQLKAFVAEVYLEEVADLDEIEGFRISLQYTR